MANGVCYEVRTVSVCYRTTPLTRVQSEEDAMYRHLIVSILAGMCCWAQAADDSQPATSNVRGAQYPRVHADLRVTFRVKAPDARKVQLHSGGDGLGKGDLDMAK